MASSNPRLGEYKGSMGSCPRVLHVSFSCFARVLFSRLGGLGGRLGVLIKNLWTVGLVYWVNVSESSGAGSPGLCRIMEH